MPLNFPSTPAVNEIYTLGDKTWKYNGQGWYLLVNPTSGYSGISGYSGYGGGGGAAANYIKVPSNYTANIGEKIIADSSTGPFTITLPATPSVGNTVYIMDGDNWYANNVTLNRNGSTIEDLSEDLVLDIAHTALELVYDGQTWEVVSNVGTSGYSGIGGPGIYSYISVFA